MKLSKLASISLTSSATIVFMFGVWVTQSQAQDTRLGSLSLTEVGLETPPATSGFGLVVQNWMEDMQARMAGDPELVQQQAERALARLKLAAESGDSSAAEDLELARQRYESKMEQVESLLEGSDNAARERVLAAMARHQAVIEQVFEDAPENLTAGLQQTFVESLERGQQVLNTIPAQKRVAVGSRVEANREAFKERLETQQTNLTGSLSIRQEKLEERRLRLEELRQQKLNLAAGGKDETEAARESLKSRVQQDKLELEKEAAETRKTAQVKFAERASGIEKVEERAAQFSTEDMEKIQGAVDYQPVGFWSRLGYWLAGN